MRRILKLAIACSLILCSLPSPLAAAPLWPAASGYAGAQSVVQGGAIDFHVSCSTATYDMVFFRYGAALEEVGRVNGLPGVSYACPESHLGCGWPVAYTLVVPDWWSSGLYAVRLLTPGESLASDWGEYMWFIVREAEPGSTSRVLLVLPDNTWQAYNYRGGLSFYPDETSGRGRYSYLSFDRPYGGPTGPSYAPSPIYLEEPALRWVEQSDHVVEYAGNYDLHSIPDLLSHYDVHVTIGHDEYWSWEMRDRVEAFIAGGGDAIFFSSNTSYWQVRYEDEGRTLVGFKSDYPEDPYYTDGDPANDHLITHLWCGDVVNRCEAAMTGVTYVNGGRAKLESCTYCVDGYTASRPDHWAYAGVKNESGWPITNGDKYGYTATYGGIKGIAAKEVDGALYEWGVDPTGPSITAAGLAQGTPANFMILAYFKSIRDAGGAGYGTMGIYTNGAGATVFSSGSWDWANVGLMSGHATVVQVTQNVFDRIGWGRACAAPAVRIERDGGDIVLRWAARAATEVYEVHRSTTPDFEPTAATLIGTVTQAAPPVAYYPPYAFTDGGAGQPGSDYFWIVRAGCGAGQVDSRLAAKFEFPLVAGSNP